MSDSLFSRLIAPNLAPYKYTRALLSALTRTHWVYDSADFATIEEEDAWNKIRRDSTIAAGIENRRRSVAGIKYSVRSVSDAKADVIVARAQNDLYGEVRHFWRGRYNLTEAIFRGSSWALIRGTYRQLAIAGAPPIRLWVPTELEHVDRHRIRLSSEGIGRPGDARVPMHWELYSPVRDQWERIPPERLRWFIRHYYEQTESDLGYGRGLLASLYFFWKAKEVAIAEGLNGLEFWARGLVIAKIDSTRHASPDRTADEAAEAAREELAAHRSEHILSIDKGDDVQVVQGGGTGHQLCLNMVKYLDDQMLRLIQAGSLSTGQGNDQHGSYGQAEAQRQEKADYFYPDRLVLAEDIHHDLGGLMWRANQIPLRRICAYHGVELGRPGEFTLSPEERIEPKDALEALKSGLPLLKREVYDQLGYTVPPPDADEDDIITLPQAGAGGMMAPGAEPPLPPPPTEEDLAPLDEFGLPIEEGPADAAA